MLIKKTHYTPGVSSVRILGKQLSGCYQKTCKCMQRQLMHPRGNKPSLNLGVGGTASCLGLRGRKHPSVSPGSRSRQHNCVGNGKLWGLLAALSHTAFWKEKDIFLQQRKGNCSLLSISAHIQSTARRVALAQLAGGLRCLKSIPDIS